jgi:hypothetical protein
MGDVNWLKARHAEGALANQPRLVSRAVSSGRPEILGLLLELGFDPDESGRVAGLEEAVPTWGEPLRECARAGRFALAEILLEHGANPNTNVYAASSALSLAYSRQADAMIGLLERHGGKLTRILVGDLGLVSRAAAMLADDAAGRTSRIDRAELQRRQDLLWSAIGCPSPEIVRMALGRIDWQRDDLRGTGSSKMRSICGPKAIARRTWRPFVWRWIVPTRTSRANGARRCCTISRRRVVV